MSQNDSNIYKPFIIVLGALVAFTILIAIIANMYSPKLDRATDPLVQQGLKKQIAPIGQSRVGHSDEGQDSDMKAEGESAEKAAQAASEESESDSESASNDSTSSTTSAAVATAAVTTAAATTAAVVNAEPKDAVSKDDAKSGDSSAVTDDSAAMADAGAEIPIKVRAVVATNCAGCHQEGIRGAPRSDDAAAWNTLAEKGLGTLTQSVINGKGAMMPRADSTLNDEEISLAVQHMVMQSTGNAIDSDGAGDTAGDTESEAAESTEEADPAAVVGAVEKTEPAAATAATAATAAVASTTPAAAVATESAPASDSVKAVVNSLCAGCHISGVANAPKYGDKAAWDQRLSVGMDKVLASAIAGKGAMPARGGSQLSDAELRSAIEYMVSK